MSPFEHTSMRGWRVGCRRRGRERVSNEVPVEVVEEEGGTRGRTEAGTVPGADDAAALGEDALDERRAVVRAFVARRKVLAADLGEQDLGLAVLGRERDLLHLAVLEEADLADLDAGGRHGGGREEEGGEAERVEERRRRRRGGSGAVERRSEG